MEKPPQYVTPPPDAEYTQLKAQAQQQQIDATQTQVRGDTASLMARYGALAGLGRPAGGATMPPALSDTSPSGMPLAMALQMFGNQQGSPLAQVARAVTQKMAA